MEDAMTSTPNDPTSALPGRSPVVDLATWQAARGELEAEVFRLYGEGRYDEAVELLRNAEPELAPWRSDLAHLAACLLAAAGRPIEALQELQAALASGAWWHPRILVEDDDLAPLAELDGFAGLVAEARVRAESDPDMEVEPIVRRPSREPRGVLVALHGAGEDATDAANAWQPAVELGWVVLAVVSTQRNTPTYRSWPDASVGARDVKAALAALSDSERKLPLTLVGFSAGGRQAMLSAFGGDPAVVGFVAMAPAIRVEHLTDELLAGRTAGTMLLGDDDDDVGPDAVAVYERLRSADEAVELVRIPGLGHEFPTDFSRYLSDVLS
jgi:predicted esterase